MPTVNEDLVDLFIGHRLSVLRFESGVVGDVVRRYVDTFGPMLEDLAKLSTKTGKGIALTTGEKARLQATLARIRRDMRSLKTDLQAVLQAGISGALEVELAAAPALLEKAVASVLGSDAIASVPIADLVQAVVVPIGGLVWTDRLALDLVQEHDILQANIGVAVRDGLSIPETARRLKASTNIIETYRGRFVAIARTEIQRVSNAGALASYGANLDVIGAVQYLATLDSRTCLICAPFHNKVFKYDTEGNLPSNIPIPPLHPRCRCFLSPVTKSWRALGISGPTQHTRESLDGLAADATNFDQWLKRQPADVQFDVLGASRHAMWSSGKLALSSFSDNRSVLTLDELRARYSSV